VRIAGVIANFYFKPATYTLEPLLVRYDPNSWAMLAVKLGPGDAAQARLDLESMWKKIDPYHPFDGRMYGEVLDEVYDFFSESVTIVGFLGFLAFGISLLGLLGIVTFQVERRAREIGIRRILGAETRNLLLLLARKEAVLLLIATAIAIPAGLFFASAFLEQFAQRIELGISSVLPALGVVYLCAGGTIVVQAIRAAVANPVETLRYE
jgi:putative ABC transport system permease protein